MTPVSTGIIVDNFDLPLAIIMTFLLLNNVENFVKLYHDINR